ncbi:hypothetical protein MPSEU_000445800 [Mayamaea pseudoterrestris]|nr:hypothetical protein MPSEU_000445800 [Mayamaea pseudoterrestris]
MTFRKSGLTLHRYARLLRVRGGAASTLAAAGTAPAVTHESVTTSFGAADSAAPLDKTTTTTATNDPLIATTPTKEDPRILWLIRLLFLSYYGSLGSLLPYLPVYYHSLGHGGQIIGLLGAVKPLTTFLVAPMWGFLADQSQNPFGILKVAFGVSLLGQLLVACHGDAVYLSVMVFLTALFNAPVKSLLDSLAMSHLNDKATYGRLRLYGQIGFGLGSSLVGFLLHRSKHVAWPKGEHVYSQAFEDRIRLYPDFVRMAIVLADKFWTSLTGFKLLFLAHAALSVPTWMCIQAFRRLDDKKQAAERNNQTVVSHKDGSKANTKMSEGIMLLLQNADALLFFFLVLVVGVSSGVVENFAYIRMREVGFSGKDLGLSRLISSLAGAPMFWFSGSLTQALGADRVIVLSLMSYVTRFLIYAFMRNPYHGLVAEALRGITFAAFWSTGTIYAHAISPPGLHATMLMFLNAMYGGLGQSLGAIIGGKLQHRMGTVKTFLYSAAFDFCFVCVVVAYLSIRKESNFRDPKPIEASTTLTQNENAKVG